MHLEGDSFDLPWILQLLCFKEVLFLNVGFRQTHTGLFNYEVTKR